MIMIILGLVILTIIIIIMKKIASLKVITINHE